MDVQGAEVMWEVDIVVKNMLFAGRVLGKLFLHGSTEVIDVALCGDLMLSVSDDFTAMVTDLRSETLEIELENSTNYRTVCSGKFSPCGR